MRPGIGKRIAAGFSLSILLWFESVFPASRTVDLTLQEGTSMAATLSPDGKWVAIDLLGILWVLPAQGGTARRITDEFNDARQPIWSADGESLIFQSYRRGSWDIASVSLKGDLRYLTKGPFDDREPHLSPDGRWLAFSSDRGGDYGIWRLDLESGGLELLTHSPHNEFMPAWSPEGRRLVYVSDRPAVSGPVRLTDRGRPLLSPTIWTIDLEGGQEELAIQPGPFVDAPFSVPSPVSGPSWHPDGSSISYQLVNGSGSQLILRDRPLTAGEDVFPFRAQWISFQEVLYTADGKIKSRSMGTDTVRTIEFTASLSLERETYPRKTRDFDSTDRRPVRGIMKPVVSPDGEYVAVAALGDLWLLSATEKPRQLTFGAGLEMDPNWSPDGTRLVLSSDRGGSMDLWTLDVESGEQRQLTDLPGVERAAAWSPDGTRVAFLNQSGELHSVQHSNGSITRIHDNLSGSSYPSWSPDGRFIAIADYGSYSTRFREGISRIRVLSTEGEPDRAFSPIPHRSIGARRLPNGPVWSPDGSYMAYVMDGSLWISPVDSRGEPVGPPRRMSREPADSPSWTGDSRWLLYQSMDRLVMVSIEDGSQREVPVSLTWKPKQPQGRLVIHAESLFDGRSPDALQNMDIVLEGHRIASVQPHREELHDQRVLNTTGGTVLPGLIESHTHHRKWHGEGLGRAWLSWGVTTVQLMGGSPYQSLEDLESYAAGVRPGPRVFFGGDPFDGARASGGLSIEAGPQLEMQLERARILGYDLIKTYVRLPDLLQKRVVQYAHLNGMAVSSHELFPAVGYGTDAVAHLGATSRRGYSPKLTSLNRSYRDVIDLMSHSGMAVSSTLGVDAFPVMMARDRDLLDDRRFRQFSPPWLVASILDRVSRTGETLPIREELLNAGAQTLVRIVRGGGLVVAGTDAPIVPSGLSLHAELETLVQAGLSPFEALKAATSRAAEALGVEEQLGSIEAGRLADLIIVEGNPLRDIRHARRVRQVIRNGEVLDLEVLLPGSVPDREP